MHKGFVQFRRVLCACLSRWSPETTLALLLAVLAPAPAEAQNGCGWYGTRPFCDGQCPSGMVYTGRRESCTTGSRRYCCPATMQRGTENLRNCQWAGSPPNMLYVCDDPRGGPYAAIAIDKKGRWGASIKPPSRQGPGNTDQEARRDALRRCGPGCQVVMSGQGKCVAFAHSNSGGYWIGLARGGDRPSVERIALDGCTKGAPPGTCRLQHANCLPQ
jgi:hypothetical protein